MKNLLEILKTNNVKFEEKKLETGFTVISFPNTSLETYGYDRELFTAPLETNDLDVALTEALVSLGMLVILEQQKLAEQHGRIDR